MDVPISFKFNIWLISMSKRLWSQYIIERAIVLRKQTKKVQVNNNSAADLLVLIGAVHDCHQMDSTKPSIFQPGKANNPSSHTNTSFHITQNSPRHGLSSWSHGEALCTHKPGIKPHQPTQRRLSPHTTHTNNAVVRALASLKHTHT